MKCSVVAVNVFRSSCVSDFISTMKIDWRDRLRLVWPWDSGNYGFAKNTSKMKNCNHQNEARMYFFVIVKNIEIRLSWKYSSVFDNRTNFFLSPESNFKTKLKFVEVKHCSLQVYEIIAKFFHASPRKLSSLNNSRKSAFGSNQFAQFIVRRFDLVPGEEQENADGKKPHN